MPRKAATATFPGTSTPMGAPPAKEAPKASPRARVRLVEGGAPIDPEARNAKRDIDARFPRVRNAETVDAPEGSEVHAAEYLACNAQVKRIEERKEVLGNHLRLAIGENLAIEADEFKATWFERVGDVDWRALAKAHNISDEVIDRFRGPVGRSLRVTGKE